MSDNRKNRLLKGMGIFATLCMIFTSVFICPAVVKADEKPLYAHEELYDESDFIAGVDTVSGYSYVVEDEAGILNYTEEKNLAESAKRFTAECNIYVVTVDINEYSSTEDWLYYNYDAMFGTQDGVVFCIDMDERMIQLYSYGAPESTLTTDKQQSISDNVYSYATDGEYYKCAKKGLDQMYSVMHGIKIPEPMKYVSNGILAFVAALIIAYIIARTSSSSFKPSDSEKLKNLFSNFRFGNARRIPSGTTKKYSPRSSGSSSGGRSGGGGGHRGSSGGHRF